MKEGVDSKDWSRDVCRGDCNKLIWSNIKNFRIYLKNKGKSLYRFLLKRDIIRYAFYMALGLDIIIISDLEKA